MLIDIFTPAWCQLSLSPAAIAPALWWRRPAPPRAELSHYTPLADMLLRSIHYISDTAIGYAAISHYIDIFADWAYYYIDFISEPIAATPALYAIAATLKHWVSFFAIYAIDYIFAAFRHLFRRSSFRFSLSILASRHQPLPLFFAFDLFLIFHATPNIIFYFSYFRLQFSSLAD